MFEDVLHKSINRVFSLAHNIKINRKKNIFQKLKTREKKFFFFCHVSWLNFNFNQLNGLWQVL